MIRNEYLRFMQTLNSNGVSDDVRKLANIVLTHLDELTPLGTAGGRRAIKIVALAQREFVTTKSEVLTETEHIEEPKGITSLKSLTVGPFRGFAKSESFDLDSKLLLIYGPNGTGKSSFCEALEYGLLGSVADCESKRFKEAEDYLKNAYTGNFDFPIIEANFADKEPGLITDDEAQFRFCFVEKNRIDHFSRIAAHLPARQTELISTLFGLDNFNEFVRGFSAEIDDRYIDLSGKYALQLTIKQKSLDGERKTLLTNAQSLKSLMLEEQALANRYQQDMPFADLVSIIGSEEHPGEIHLLEEELQNPIPSPSNLKSIHLLQKTTNVKQAISNFETKKSELARYSEELSYKQLYLAVTKLTTVGNQYCPACKTPLTQTTENPFLIAETSLAKLQYLSVLEQQLNEIDITLHEALKAIYEIMEQTCTLIGPENTSALQNHRVANESFLNVEWWQIFTQLNENNQSSWKLLEEQVTQLEAIDATFLEQKTTRKHKADRLKELRQFSNQIIELQTKRKTLEDSNTTASLIIATFDETNRKLVVDVENEKAVVKQNVVIADAYSRFINLLQDYIDALPGRLVADLGELVVILYNAFNRGDASNDLLTNLKLPSASGERILISFNSEPDTYYDALHVLSEGHIRCVGLAILLAKNLKENCPILIFDDPVNAIDDDHREAIRRTLFEDDYFKGKQIILTCHGEEFFKDIQNLLGAELTKASKRFTFLPQLGDKNIRIDFQSAPRNYILAAKEHFERLETRSALEKARQALEALTKGDVWRYVSKHGDGNLSIKLRAANSSIELRNLTEQLKTKLLDQNLVHPDKDLILSPLILLLGISGDSREWRYLNKGTHEEADRAEFNRDTVNDIVNALISLDTALHNSPNSNSIPAST